MNGWGKPGVWTIRTAEDHKGCKSRRAMAPPGHTWRKPFDGTSRGKVRARRTGSSGVYGEVKREGGRIKSLAEIETVQKGVSRMLVWREEEEEEDLRTQ